MQVSMAALNKVTTRAFDVFNKGSDANLYMFFVCVENTDDKQEMASRASALQSILIYEWGLGWQAKMKTSRGKDATVCRTDGKRQWFVVCATSTVAVQMGDLPFVKSIRMTKPQKGLALMAESLFQPRRKITRDGIGITYAGRSVRHAGPVGIQ